MGPHTDELADEMIIVVDDFDEAPLGGITPLGGGSRQVLVPSVPSADEMTPGTQANLARAASTRLGGRTRTAPRTVPLRAVPRFDVVRVV